MTELLVIAGEDVAPGFRLGGFDCIEVRDKALVPTLIEDIVKEGRYGLVCIEDRFMNSIPRDLMRRIDKEGLPVMIPVTIPRSWGEGEPKESPIAALIRRAIGYHIKLKK